MSEGNWKQNESWRPDSSKKKNLVLSSLFPSSTIFPFHWMSACLYMYVQVFVCGGACRGPQLLSGTLISLLSYLMSQSLPIKFRAAMPSPAQMIYVGIQTPMLMLGGRHALATELLPSLPQGILVLFHLYFLLPPGERSQAPLPSTCYPFLNPTVLLQWREVL